MARVSNKVVFSSRGTAYGVDLDYSVDSTGKKVSYTIYVFIDCPANTSGDIQLDNPKVYIDGWLTLSNIGRIHNYTSNSAYGAGKHIIWQHSGSWTSPSLQYHTIHASVDGYSSGTATTSNGPWGGTVVKFYSDGHKVNEYGIKYDTSDYYTYNFFSGTTYGSKTGYSFGGWKDSNGTLVWNSSGKAQTGNSYWTTVNGAYRWRYPYTDLSVYAIWNANSYTVTRRYCWQDSNGSYGGWTNIDSKSYSYGTVIPAWSWGGNSTHNAVSIGAHTVTGDDTLSAYITRKKFIFDLNGTLDGSDSGGLGDYGTCNIVINGNVVSTNCNDYYDSIYCGAVVQITNINAKSGYEYGGYTGAGVSFYMPTNATSTNLIFNSVNVVYVYTNGAWHAGIPYIYADGAWHKAYSVNIRSSDGWKTAKK